MRVPVPFLVRVPEVLVDEINHPTFMLAEESTSKTFADPAKLILPGPAPILLKFAVAPDCTNMSPPKMIPCEDVDAS